MKRWTVLLGLALMGAAPAAAHAKQRVALIPFENVAHVEAARDVVMRAVEVALAKKGYEVVTGAPIEEYLHARRIRYLDSLPAAQAKDLLASQRADALVVGAIMAYTGGTEPEVALTVTVLGSDGTPLWSNVAGVVAAETVGALGLGKVNTVERLARRVTTDVFGSLPRGGHLSRVRVTKPDGLLGAPRVFRSRALKGKPVKICVLPLQNFSGEPDAPRVVDLVLHNRLSQHPDVTPVQPGDLRQAIVATSLRAPSQMSPDQLRTLAKSVGTTLFLQGAIFRYGSSLGGPVSTPALEVYLSLLDVDSGRTLWSGLHRRTGAEYEKLLLFGAVHDPVTLASRTVTEMIEAFTH
jgi:hypothetical protein